jgi:hypothetical protein
MSKKAERPQSRRHIWVFDEDWEYLQELYGGVASPLTPSAAIRQVVHTWVKRQRAAEVTSRDNQPVTSNQ